MAHYLVQARPRDDRLQELEGRLASGEVRRMRPFGRSLSVGLRGARVDRRGTAWWEEEDYCSPPLKEERAVVLDDYFEDLRVEPVTPEEGWRQVLDLPYLFPAFAEEDAVRDAGRDAMAWVRENRRRLGGA